MAIKLLAISEIEINTLHDSFQPMNHSFPSHYKYIFSIYYQQQQQQVNPRYRPQGTAESGLLGTLKRIQLANVIYAH